MQNHRVISFEPFRTGCLDYKAPIVINGYKFIHNTSRDNPDSNEIRCCYRCSICKTTATVVYSKVQRKITEVTRVTTHKSCHKNGDDKKVLKMKKDFEKGLKLLENSNLKPTEVDPTTVSADSKYLKKDMKRKLLIPTTFQQLVQQEDKHPMILANESDNIIIFGTTSGLTCLANTGVILADGIFRMVHGDGQMYIFHSYISNKCFASLFVKMKDRTITSYTKMFQMIQHLGEERNLNILKRNVVFKADFEQAVISTIVGEYPNVQFSGCYFHFSYNIMKNMRDMGLRDEYKRNIMFNTFVRRIRNLCLLSNEYISDITINAICSPCDESRLATSEKYQLFKKYLKETWLNEDAKNNVDLWNVCGQNVRTNNFSEALNCQINDMTHKRPDLLGELQIIESIFQRDKQKSKNRTLKQGRKTTPFINKILKFLLMKLQHNMISFLDYIDLVGYDVQIRNMAEYNEYVNKYLMTSNFEEYNRSEVLRRQKTGYYSKENDRTEITEVAQDLTTFREFANRAMDEVNEAENVNDHSTYPDCYYKALEEGELDFCTTVNEQEEIDAKTLFEFEDNYPTFLEWYSNKSCKYDFRQKKILKIRQQIDKLNNQKNEYQVEQQRIAEKIAEIVGHLNEYQRQLEKILEQDRNNNETNN